MNCQQMASVAFACVLVFGGPAPAPVWAQVAPAIERNPAAAGASAVAVLPFENISGQPQDDWLGAGIVESVLADLETRNVAVIGPAALRAEARREGTDLEVERNAIALSRRLGAAWLVTGGYQHVGDLLRITARVVDVRTGAVTNTVKVDGRWEDLFRAAGSHRGRARPPRPPGTLDRRRDGRTRCGGGRGSDLTGDHVPATGGVTERARQLPSTGTYSPGQ